MKTIQGQHIALQIAPHPRHKTARAKWTVMLIQRSLLTKRADQIKKQKQNVRIIVWFYKILTDLGVIILFVSIVTLWIVHIWKSWR